MEYNLEQDVIRKALINMLTDKEVDIQLIKSDRVTKLTIIYYALHFSEMFFKNEVGNMVEYFEKLYNKEIELKISDLNQQEFKFYFAFIDDFIEKYIKKERSEKLKPNEKKINIKHNIRGSRKRYYHSSEFNG